MIPLVGAALASAGLGLVGDIAGIGAQYSLQHEAWDREDTAVQRRVKDLRAAGLSPTLAAGSAAGSSSPINVMQGFSRAGDRAGQAVEGAVEMKLKNIGIRKLAAEAGQSEADRRRAEAEAKLAEARVPYADQLAQADYYQRWYGSQLTENRMNSEEQHQYALWAANEITRRFGIRRAEAETLVREMEQRFGATRESMFGKEAGGAAQFLPFVEMILKILKQ